MTNEEIERLAGRIIELQHGTTPESCSEIGVLTGDLPWGQREAIYARAQEIEQEDE
jgi:hypothetical protein